MYFDCNEFYFGRATLVSEEKQNKSQIIHVLTHLLTHTCHSNEIHNPKLLFNEAIFSFAQRKPNC